MLDTAIDNESIDYGNDMSDSIAWIKYSTSVAYLLI